MEWWLDVRTGKRPIPAHPSLPASSVCFSTGDLQQTHGQPTARRIQLPLPPVRQPSGRWWLFQDLEGKRFAVVPQGQ